MNRTRTARSPRLARSTTRFALTLALIPCAFAADPPRDADEVLSEVRAALGWDQLRQSGGAVLVRGDARFLGTDAEQTILFDGQGRFRQSLEGRLAQRSGFDGETAWAIDWTNTPRVLELGDRANARVSALFLSGAWTAADCELQFVLAEEQQEGERALSFQHPDGTLTGHVRIDAESGLPLEVRFGADGNSSSWSFSAFRDHDGFRFPDQVVLRQQALEQRLDTRSVELLTEVPDGRFAAELTPPGDTRFQADLPPTLEVRQVVSGHLLVHPSIGGLDLGWFILDSGAGINCIAKHVADQLEDGPFGEIIAKGIGGNVPAQFWRADDLQLGPVTIEDPLFMELDLEFLEQPFGVPVGGILGFELFARCVVEMDMIGATIALHDPSAYELPEQGRWEEAVIYGRHPCVRAAIEGAEGLFKIDTGAASDTVTMHFHAVNELGLLEGRKTHPGMAGGVGGQVGTRNGELASFDLGGHRFEPLTASFAVEDKGAFSDAYIWGNIGGKLLAPFVLVFDYPNQRMGFVPR